MQRRLAGQIRALSRLHEQLGSRALIRMTGGMCHLTTRQRGLMRPLLPSRLKETPAQHHQPLMLPLT